MRDTQILEQLHIIYILLTQDNNKKAEQVFMALKIVDTAEHLALPESTRHLVWDLYEYLVLDDKNNATDKQQILQEFRELFSKK